MTEIEHETQAALMLAALGNETRLRIYRLLVRAGHDGLHVGEVQSRLSIPGSTLTHHLGALRQAGLIEQCRQGRAIVCSAKYEAMDGLVSYLTDECCRDVEPVGTSGSAASTATAEEGEEF